jgi:cobalt-zinc-cadmium efflux system membrane fusion protein
MSNRKYLLNVLLMIVITGLISCTRFRNKTETDGDNEILPEDIVEMRDDQIKLAGIETGAVEMRFINTTLNVNGKVAVAPQNMATVCAPLGGFIINTSLLPGNAVSKGQVLAIIENQEFIDIQKNYMEAKDKLEFAEAEFIRHTDLYKEDVYSKQNLQQVTADYRSLKAQVTALEQKLALIGIDPSTLREDNISRTVTLRSPISGYIKTVNVNIGKFVSATDVLFEIINTDKLLLELTLFEKDMSKVSNGQKLRFYINDETEEHDAVIYQTARSVEADKTYRVYAQVTQKCNHVIPGMYVNAVIETSGEKVTALPDEAIVSFDDKNYIFVFERNKEEDGKPFTEYRIVEVKKNITDGIYSSVTLPEGFNIDTTKVVLKGAYNLLCAMKNAGEMAC